MLSTWIEKALSLQAPISRATVPLINGLGRQRLLRSGAEQCEVRIGDTYVNYYHKEPPETPAAELPILLVHGIADSSLTWSFVFNPLARTHPLYAIDLPGYGFSTLPAGRGYASLDEMRDLLEQFVREVIGRPTLVVGNSMGGWVAVKLAWADSALTRGVVLMDAGGAPLKGLDSWMPFGETIGIRDMKTARLITRQMFGGIPAPLLYLGQHSLQELFQRQVVREFVAHMVAVAPEAVLLRADDLRRLPVPAALIWGLSDQFLPAGSLEFFRENLPDAPALLLRRCGHLPQRERPLSVVRFIRQFAAQLTEEPRAEQQDPRTVVR